MTPTSSHSDTTHGTIALPRAPFISVAELDRFLREGKAPVLLDVRWQLGRSDGYEQYLQAHIPGAKYVDLETELAAAPSAAMGRHPLPEQEAFNRSRQDWGVFEDSVVVVYDAVNGLSAARAWWLLRHFGVRSVFILEGGFTSWRDAHPGQEVSSQESGSREPTTAGNHDAGNAGTSNSTAGARERGSQHEDNLAFGHMPVITEDEAAAFPTHGELWDARASARYQGDEEPVDPRAGHIPGAKSAPTADNLTEHGLLKSADELRSTFGDKQGGATAVYCGSGVTASHEIAVLESIGISAAMYPGSWSQYSSNPHRPVAIGS